MDITKLYTKNGTVIAAQLTDNNESYPVLFEALSNDVLLPELIKSGWKLTALPLTLNKNGVDLMSLPKAEWTDELERQYGQDMYDMLGTAMPMDDRRKLIDHGPKSATFTESGKYQINTREEFLSYLDSIRDGVPDNDYMPLNYVVHPNARFSIDEFLHSDKYADIITNRRKLSYTRYTRLCKFLQQHGMPAKFTDVDFLRAYMQWGVDGIQFSYRGNPEVSAVPNVHDYALEFSQSTNMMEPVEIHTYATRMVYVICVRTQTGMTVIPPKGYTDDQLFDSEHMPRYDFEIRNPRCHFRLTADEDAMLRSLPLGGSIVVKRKVVHPKYQWECACDHPIGHIIAEFEFFKFGSALRTAGISISTPAGTPLPVVHIGNDEEIRVSGFAMAISQMIANKRKADTSCSLYKALRVNGYSDYSALTYFVNTNKYYDMSNQAMMGEDEVFPVITADMVRVFLQAKAEPDRYDEIIATMPVYPAGNATTEETIALVADTLSGVLEGSTNNARLDKAFEEESRVNAMMYYPTLRAITMCTDITIDAIYNQLRSWVPGNPVIVDFGQGKITMDGAKFDRVQREYDNQVRIIRYDHVCKAPFYVWIDGIIKEFGDRSYDKHIGFFGTVLDASKPAAQRALDAFANFYAQCVLDDLEQLKGSDPVKYERLAFNFLHVPGNTVLSVNALDDTPIGRTQRAAGVAKFFAAIMLMQGLKQGMFRINTPKRKNELHYLTDHPELKEMVEKARKCLMVEGKMLHCDCKSFADNIHDDAPFDYMPLFYTVNAVVTEDQVHPRINCNIPVYDPVYCYNYSTFEDIYTSAGTPEKLPGNVDKIFYRRVEIQSDYDGVRDLLHSTVGRDRTRSKMYDYYQAVLAVAKQWKSEGSTTKVATYTGTWGYPDIEAVDSFEPNTDNSGLPCFKPGGWAAYRVEYVHDSVAVGVVERDVKPFLGVTCEEYSVGVSTFEPPAQAGHKGILNVIGNSIYAAVHGQSEELRELNPSDISTLDQNIYPVKHLYGARWVFRTVDGKLFYVEV